MPDISTGFARLSGMLDSAKNALRPSVLGDSQQRRSAPLPFYRFEVWTDDGPAKAADLSGPILTATKGTIALRLPPASYMRERPVRSEVTLDLAGEVVVYDGGLGLGRCSLRGTHGVGVPNDQLAKLFGKDPKKAPDGESAGLLTMLAIRGFFEDWADLNQKRKKEDKPPTRIAFSIRGGSWTEYREFTRWIVLNNLPTEERNIGRPLEWAWSVSWMDLGPMLPKSAGADFAKPASALDLAKQAGGLADGLGGFLGPLNARNLTGVLASAKEAANNLRKIQGQLQDIRRDTLGVVTDVTDTVRQIAGSATDILKSVDPSSFGDEVLQNLRGTAMDTRLFAGEVKRWGSTLGLPSVPERAPSAFVLPQASLQQISQQQGQGFSAWPGVADQNGLRYPFVES